MWSFKTCVLLHVKSIAMEKSLFPTTTKIVAILWTVAATAKRLMVLVVYFTPCFGLFSLLHHWQYERIQFSVRKNVNVKADDMLLLHDIQPIPWSELDRWNYHDDPKKPTPPPYSLYSFYGIGDYFKLFWIIVAAHIVINICLKLLTSRSFQNKSSILEKIIHGIEICNLPAPWKDWDEDAITVKEHFENFKAVKVEMFVIMLVNFTYSCVMLLPIAYTGKIKKIWKQSDLEIFSAKSIWARHQILEYTIGTKEEEDDSNRNAKILVNVTFSSFLLLSFLELFFFLLYNSYVSRLLIF